MADGPFPWSESSVRQMNSTPAEFIRSLRLAYGSAVSEDETGVVLNAQGAMLHFA